MASVQHNRDKADRAADEGPRSHGYILQRRLQMRYRELSIRMPLSRCDGQPRETQPATTRDTMVSSHVAAVTFVSGFTHSGHHSKAIVPAPHTAAHQRRRGMANCLHQVITLVNLLTG